MAITFLEPLSDLCMEPINADDGIGQVSLGKWTFHDVVKSRLEPLTSLANVQVGADFWPSLSLVNNLQQNLSSTLITDESGGLLLSCLFNETERPITSISKDDQSFLVRYPWQLLAVIEDHLASCVEPAVLGTVREGVTVDGILHLGKGSILLPGVFIEGTVVIGDNCRIGPNCYVRGSTSIGDNCRIGQAVEIKNSVIMSDTAIGHLSYVGDSVIGTGVNLGAGTITANFRHDGANHRSRVGMELVDTGRTKFGTVIGNGVHTGIHTSIYPGRKLAAHASTLPGAVVSEDIGTKA